MIYTILVLSGISSFIVQTVLVLRTYALWECRNGIFRLLMSLNILGSLAQQGVVATVWHPNVITIPWNPLPAPYTGCMVIFDLPPWQKRGRSHRVLYVLFRDGFKLFIVASLLSLLMAIIGNGSEGSSHLTNITFNLVSAISMICCARLLLNIRDVMTLSDPRDSTKPNPWSLSPSFDEHYGDVEDPRDSTTLSSASQIEMFDTFFQISERVSRHPEATVEVLSIPSDESIPRGWEAEIRKVADVECLTQQANSKEEQGEPRGREL
ncbi:hypothetical protein DL93DRAFT_540540 [Clavulina sp. PMI_390]|nr:hypothetical protein DL93DRAFT_540540 [Clavulina sp. PMI_390]